MPPNLKRIMDCAKSLRLETSLIRSFKLMWISRGLVSTSMIDPEIVHYKQMAAAVKI